MSSYVAQHGTTTAVTVDVLLRGLVSAYDRFMREGRIAADPFDAYVPIFEALNWAAVVDARLATHYGTVEKPDWSWRDRFAGGEVVAGFRYARNSAQHDWADPLLDVEGCQ